MTCEFYQKPLEFRNTTLPESGPVSTSNPFGISNESVLLNSSFGFSRDEGLNTVLLPNNNGQADPRIIFDFSLSASRNHFEKSLLYATHWEKHCLPSLSNVFAHFSTRMDVCPVLFNAILAFSACNMSRKQPETKTSDTLRDRYLTHRPHHTHHLHGQMYYNSAIQKLARLSPGQYGSNRLEIFVTMILFCYMESSLCNFHGYYCHVNGVSSLLKTDIKNFKFRSSGDELLIAWEHSKYYNWWIRIHFCTLNFQSSQNALHMPLPKQDSEGPSRSRHMILLSSLCESYRLSSKAFLHWWNIHSVALESVGVDLEISYQEDYTSQLLKESKRLDEWESQLTVSELPTKPISLEIPNYRDLSDPFSGLDPIHFVSHEASVNYAYYVAARAMQSSWGRHEVHSRNLLSHDSNANDYWTTLLLRVVRGINKSDCLRQSVYTIGISSLPLACVLRSTDLRAGICTETWLKELQQANVFEEGSLPIGQNIAVVSMINCQRRAGYDIFAISPALEYDDGHGKFDSYNNQTLSDVLVYGRDRRTSCAFSSCVPLSNDYGGE